MSRNPNHRKSWTTQVSREECSRQGDRQMQRPRRHELGDKQACGWSRDSHVGEEQRALLV